MQTGPDAHGTVENDSGSAKRDPTPLVPLKTSMGEQNKKIWSDALGIAENELGRAKHENGTRCHRHVENESDSAKHEKGTLHPRYRRKRAMEHKTRKQDLTHTAPPKTFPGAEHMETGHDALGTAENESGRAKHENGTRRRRYRWKWLWGCKTGKRDPTPSEPPKMSPGAQNKKTGSDAPDNAANEFGSTKHKKGTLRPRYRRKRVRERKTWKRDPMPLVPPKTSMGVQNRKTGPDELGIAENESGRAKQEHGTRRPRFRQIWVRERKTWKRDPTPLERPKMSPGAQKKNTGLDAPVPLKTSPELKNVKTGPDAHGTAETSLGAQNLKKGPNALGTDENEFGRAKQEN
jgi:hypothetical protein